MSLIQEVTKHHISIIIKYKSILELVTELDKLMDPDPLILMGLQIKKNE